VLCRKSPSQTTLAAALATIVRGRGRRGHRARINGPTGSQKNRFLSCSKVTAASSATNIVRPFLHGERQWSKGASKNSLFQAACKSDSRAAETGPCAHAVQGSQREKLERSLMSSYRACSSRKRRHALKSRS
jgi:hypothetical protein